MKLGPKTAALVSQITSVEHIEVNSEIEALLLESRLIKKFLPPYNLSARDDKSPYYIHITAEKWPRPVVNHQPKGAIAGPFLSGLAAKRILGQFRRIAPFCTAPRKVSRPCLYWHLGLCQPCPNDPAADPAQYRQNIIRLKRLLRGHFPTVMRQTVKDQRFETAAALRDLLAQPVLPDEYLVNPNLVADRQKEAIQALQAALRYHPEGELWPHRIEMYDVSHLAGTAATAAMTVAVDGEVNSKNFRHFTIKTKSTPNDVAMLREILERRLKRIDWPKPDLIVLDGGKSQLSIAKRMGFNPLRLQTDRIESSSIIALAKKEEIIHTLNGQEIKLDRRNPGLQLLQHLRDEAHRFSRRLHHKHRQKQILNTKF